jgi:hypothetical protein
VSESEDMLLAHADIITVNLFVEPGCKGGSASIRDADVCFVVTSFKSYSVFCVA